MEKTRKRRIWMVLGAVCLVLLVAYGSLLICLTLQDMERVENPAINQVEDGVWNLTAEELHIPAEKLGDYILHTNSTKIKVTAEMTGGEGRIRLTRVEVPGEWLMENVVNSENDSITFNNLCAADRYIVSCEGLDGVMVTVSEGVEANFWESFQYVHQNLLNKIGTWWFFNHP